MDRILVTTFPLVFDEHGRILLRNACATTDLSHIVLEEGDTEELFISRYLKTYFNPDERLHAKVINKSLLPYEGNLRDAWSNPADDTSPPFIDMQKAHTLKMAEYRRRRLIVLADLDIAYQRADEQGDTNAKTLIAVEKQKLRDMPVNSLPIMTAITEPEALDNYDPVLDIVINMPVF